MENKENISKLYESMLSGETSKEELKEFVDLTKDPNNEQVMYELMDESYAKVEGILAMKEKQQKKVIPLYRRLVVAASFILLAGIGAYVFFQQGKPSEHVAVVKDIPAPDASRAQLTLADGKVVYLDEINNGNVATEDGVQISKKDGEVIYTGNTNELAYNTLSNPRGSQVIHLTLSDGSKVWLNAESSLKYPVSFAGSERKVEVTGEAYFEVAHDQTKQFIVQSGEVSTAVLGTHFNVNSYKDEASVKITLLEGSVEVKSEKSKVKIIPGEQAVVNESISVNKNVDIESVMAWKNGKFQMYDANMETIMREVARWYDVEVVYEAKIKDRYRVEMSRSVSISKLLESMQLMGGFKFEVEGRKIIVTK